MAAAAAAAPKVNGVPKATPNGVPVKKPAAKVPAKKPNVNAAAKAAPAQRATPVLNKASSVAGEAGGITSPYAIMASRIANRVAEMAENITFVERPKTQAPPVESPAEEKKKPRKLEMRLPSSGKDSIAFSAPFLDNTLQKMLHLQNRMLTTTADLSKSEGVDEKIIKEHAAQSAELSRIIALICAEKARQGA